MRIIKKVSPPAGLSRLAFRAPIWLYERGLGWIFGRRLLLLNHIGRVTGQQRHVVLEVVEYDPADGSYVVASGWGTTAAWYRNLVAQPQVSIQVGRSTIPVTAVVLETENGADIFARYAGKHRIVAKYLLPRLMGYSVDGSEADFRAVGQRVPFVRFEPR